jgi:hypothetical protein
MKDNTKKKAPRVPIPSRKKPMSFFREDDVMRDKSGRRGRKSAMAPMTGKKLSK